MVIVEYLTEKVDVNIEGIIRKKLIIYADSTMLKVGMKQLRLNPTFELVLVTSLTRPKFGVNICNHVNLVNFYVSQEGMHENLLSMVVANERADLQSSLNESSETAFTAIRDLKELENSLLENLASKNAEQLVEDEIVLQLLEDGAKAAEIIASKLRQVA